jgi:hypothetical protein
MELKMKFANAAKMTLFVSTTAGKKFQSFQQNDTGGFESMAENLSADANFFANAFFVAKSTVDQYF